MLAAFTAGLLLTIALGLVTTAALPSLSYRTPQTRFALLVSLLVVFALLTLAPLILLRPLSAAGSTPGDVVHAWTRLYGRDTQQAALLTTDSFRHGEEPHAWGARVQAALQVIGYQHLGGELFTEKLTGDSALVTLKARIVAIDGVSTQTEVYTLKRIQERWLIDQLEVRDEAVPGGKLRHGI